MLGKKQFGNRGKMKFRIEGVRTVVTTTTEKVVGEIEVTKKNVMNYTGCPSKIDGDSTGWYTEVEDAMKWTKNFPYKDVEIDESTLISTESETSWESIEVDW